MTPSLKALADSPARVNRDMARQLAIPLGLSKEVEDLCLNHECSVCGKNIEHCHTRDCIGDMVIRLAAKHLGWNGNELDEKFHNPFWDSIAKWRSNGCLGDPEDHMDCFWKELRELIGGHVWVGNRHGTRWDWICEVVDSSVYKYRQLADKRRWGDMAFSVSQFPAHNHSK